MSILCPSNTNAGFKFPDEANRIAKACETPNEKFLVQSLLDTDLKVAELAKYAYVTRITIQLITFEPLARTCYAKTWWWKPNSIKCESNFIDTFRRTRAGLNPEPGTDHFRWGYETTFKHGSPSHVLTSMVT